MNKEHLYLHYADNKLKKNIKSKIKEMLRALNPLNYLQLSTGTCGVLVNDDENDLQGNIPKGH
jgi:hypothetical protein